MLIGLLPILRAIDFAINLALVHQLTMVANRNQNAIIYDEDTVCVHDRGDALRDKQRCYLTAK
jgi:hypothetical protein